MADFSPSPIFHPRLNHLVVIKKGKRTTFCLILYKDKIRMFLRVCLSVSRPTTSSNLGET